MADLSKQELRDAVYKLFSKGNLPHSDKVKALVPKAGARNLYHHTWKQSGKPEHYEKGVVEAPEGVVTGFAGILTEPRGETEAEFPGGLEIVPQTEVDPEAEVEQTKVKQTEVNQAETYQAEEEQQEQEQQPRAEKRIEPSPGGSDESETFAGLKVAGETLPFKVHLSVKTIALYEIAATEARDGLTLGKFLDTCARDYFVGRGMDLGLVELGGK